MKRTQDIMDRTIPEVLLGKVPFLTAIEQVARLGNLRVDVEWDKFKDSGLQRDTPVSIRLRNVRLVKIFRTLIDAPFANAQGLSASELPIVYVKPDGQILITTQPDMFARFGETKRYEVGDIIDDFIQQTGSATAKRSEAKEALSSLIKDTIAAGTWAEKPGDPGGTISFDGNTMVVHTDAMAQQTVAGLFEKIRVPRRSPASQPR